MTAPLTEDVAAIPAAPHAVGWWQAVLLAVGISAVAAVITGLTVWSLTRPVGEPPNRFAVASPPGIQPSGPVLAPDGRTIAFQGTLEGGGLVETRVYVRPLNQVSAVPLQGTQGTHPVGFSPDGRWLLVADATRTLMRVPLAGGQATPISEDATVGADWGQDDTIVQGSNAGLQLIPALGGEPTQLTTLSEGEEGHYNPQFLPNGRAFLFSIAAANQDTAQVAVYDFDTGEQRTPPAWYFATVRRQWTSRLLARRVAVGRTI